MSIPASASAGMSSTETYFVAATIVTSGPTSSRTRASRSAIGSADKAKDALCAARPARAALTEEQIGVAARAEIEPVDARGACVARRSLGRGPEVEDAAADDVVPEARLVRACHLVPHLVAARADRGTYDRGEARPEDLRRRLDDPVEQAAPAGVEDCERGLSAVHTGHGDESAVGPEREHRDPELVCPEAVAGRAAGSGLGAVHIRGVRLVTEGQALVV